MYEPSSKKICESKIVNAIKKELQIPATNTFHAMFKDMLEDDLKRKNFDTARVRLVKKWHKTDICGIF